MLAPGGRCALGALLLAALAGCERAPERRPDILLVSIDTLRADRLGAYGAERDTSPVLDRLASEGALFETVLAPTSWTLPSHVTLFTGMSIPAHGVDETSERLDPERRTLAQHLRGAGYRTRAFVSAPLLHRDYGFARGFEAYSNFGTGGATQPLRSPGDGAKAGAAGLVALVEQSSADETAALVIDHAVEWLEGRGAEREPFYLFVHLWDPHYDYNPPQPWAELFDPDYRGDLDPSRYAFNRSVHAQMPERDLEHVRALYDAEVRWTDSQLGRLLEALRARDRSDETVVSVVSDHGEEFFEHGHKGHSQTLFEESVRVPWILRYPPAVPAGRRVGGVASLEDVAPTLLALAGLEPLPEATGRSLAPFLASDSAGEPRRPALLALRERVALRGAGWKVLLDRRAGTAVHYDLEADPEERQPRPARSAAPERLEALRERLEQAEGLREALSWSGPQGRRVELDASTRSRLRELGYLE